MRRASWGDMGAECRGGATEDVDWSTPSVGSPVVGRYFMCALSRISRRASESARWCRGKEVRVGESQWGGEQR